VLPPLVAAIAIVVADQRLFAARRRVARIEEELPTVLEFLALCLAAGEGLRDALRRVGDVGSGVLTEELRAAVLASGTGSSLSDALLTVAKTSDVPALSRAVEHLVAAIDRGAPLAQVLQTRRSTRARTRSGSLSSLQVARRSDAPAARLPDSAALGAVRRVPRHRHAQARNRMTGDGRKEAEMIRTLWSRAQACGVRGAARHPRRRARRCARLGPRDASRPARGAIWTSPVRRSPIFEQALSRVSGF
jgi:hypothetical protein